MEVRVDFFEVLNLPNPRTIAAATLMAVLADFSDL
jgi:hypothetical protein